MADPRWPPFDNHDVITTSYDIITSRCDVKKGIFRRTFSRPSLIVIPFIPVKLWRGADSPHPGRFQKTKNSLISIGLNASINTAIPVINLRNIVAIFKDLSINLTVLKKSFVFV